MVGFVLGHSVGHETSGKDELASRVYGWRCLARCELDHQVMLGQKEIFIAYDEGSYPFADKGLEGGHDLAGAIFAFRTRIRVPRTCSAFCMLPLERRPGMTAEEIGTLGRHRPRRRRRTIQNSRDVEAKSRDRGVLRGA
jgi:hypothetical protein